MRASCFILRFARLSGLGVLDIFFGHQHDWASSPLLRHLPTSRVPPSNPLVRPDSVPLLRHRPPRPAGGRAGRFVAALPQKIEQIVAADVDWVQIR